MPSDRRAWCNQRQQVPSFAANRSSFVLSLLRTRKQYMRHLWGRKNTATLSVLFSTASLLYQPYHSAGFVARTEMSILKRAISRLAILDIELASFDIELAVSSFWHNGILDALINVLDKSVLIVAGNERTSSIRMQAWRIRELGSRNARSKHCNLSSKLFVQLPL